MVGKYRTWLGRPNPIDAKKLGFVGRTFAFILILFLITMPLTAINGIVTVALVMINQPENSEEILNYGGILGHQVYLQIPRKSIARRMGGFEKSTRNFSSLSFPKHCNRRSCFHFRVDS